MDSMKGSLLRASATALVCAAALGFAAERVAAQTALVGSDIPAAIVTYPLVAVDEGVDTYIQLANTNVSEVRSAQCFYINGLGSCSNSGEPCLVNFDCEGAFGGEQCVPAWVETNFFIQLTANQPLGWQASQGLQNLPCDGIGPDSDPFCGDLAQTAGGAVAAAQPPFQGFLTCITTDGIDADSNPPLAANDLIGTGTVITGDPLDTMIYNAIGIQATDNVGGDRHLCLGGGSDNCPDAEYASCPQTLLMNHLFDYSSLNGTQFRTRLILIPCTQLEAPRPGFQVDVVATTAQFLIYNEFEQRMSTSTRASCYTDLALSDIDTRASYDLDDFTSVFNIAVQGTLGGQTRIRGVSTLEQDVGHGLLGIAVQEQIGDSTFSSAAVNLNFVGTRGQPDVICYGQGTCEPNEP